ncbi:MAG TPA: copper homeostasis protein CutC [Streptosporangiaceae bacterium]|nr:copper homeostasis protein CutC [Streptosporangiaceae bacterium]
MLEIIVLDAADAGAAQEGGADRLEVVADMAADGLTPDPVVVREIRAATDLPLRAMLRANARFTASTPEIGRLCRAAEALAEAGADGFVFGFLDDDGRVDVAATGKLVHVIAPLPWTFHRAVDHAADPAQAWRAVCDLAPDAVLTAGSPRGVDAGVDLLVRRAARTPGLVLAGGGLRRKHVAVLAAAGVDAFHVGGGVRPGGSWERPVSAGLVREWRGLVSAVNERLPPVNV